MLVNLQGAGLDSIGLANILNAGGRKLLSHQSLLITGSNYWFTLAPSVAQYTSIGDAVSAVHWASSRPSTASVWWAKSSGDKNHLVLQSPRTFNLTAPLEEDNAIRRGVVGKTRSLKTSLQRLIDTCSIYPPFDASFPPDDLSRFGSIYFSPLTFCYVLSDLIRRVGSQNLSALMTNFISILPPVFRKSFEPAIMLGWRASQSDISERWLSYLQIWRWRVLQHIS